MLSQAPSAIDTLQGQLPPGLKWLFGGVGAAAGYAYAVQRGGNAASCVVAGAAIGFILIVCLFAALRLLKFAGGGVILLIVLNYAVLIPFGYGDHAGSWAAMILDACCAVWHALVRMLNQWIEGLH
jgi:hypothetical protein